MNCRAICICILVTLTLFRGDSETSQNWIALTAYRKASISILFPGLWAVHGTTICILAQYSTSTEYTHT